MALPSPPIDPRRYSDLVDELVARIPVHTPEWTNFNAADPGITLVQLFAHIAESLIYRTNQIPARNRAKFLQLLGQPLAPATAASGLVAFANERGPTDSAILSAGTELLAGPITYLTSASLDVLPVEGQLFIKRPLTSPPPQALVDYYSLLYASYGRPEQDIQALKNSLTLYESLAVPAGSSIDFAASVDRTLWIALLGRDIDRQSGDQPWGALRQALAGRKLSLGLVPDATATERRLGPQPASAVAAMLSFERPAAEAALPRDADGRPEPAYVTLPARADFDPLLQPGIVELTLPAAASLSTWTDLDPLEAGVGNLPPAIDDAAIAGRLITWIAVRAGAASDLKLRWAGINAAPAKQYAMVNAEPLSSGDGTPDQQRRLGRAPVLPGSVIITGIPAIAGSKPREWQEIDDILVAGPEIPVHDAPAARRGPTDVFSLDAEAGVVSFGDGLTGRRPELGEALYASYGWSNGAAGNVGAGALKAGPLLLAGIGATNPLPMSGGADAETIATAEKQIPRVIQHRDRLVTAADFRSIAWRTPGVAVGRIDVLPAAHPDIAPVAIGTAPGAVTLLAIPAFDPVHPAAPRGSREFFDALCRQLDPRRLVTTELVVRGPDYVGIWISVGIEIAGGHGAAEVVAAVSARLTAFLSPLPPPGTSLDTLLPALFGAEPDPASTGWPLGRAVFARSLLAEAARTPGVVAVINLLLARGSQTAAESVPLTGLELPEILGISVVAGDPVPLDLVRGAVPPTASDQRRLPVPVVAESC
jgi:hypothetical protein